MNLINKQKNNKKKSMNYNLKNKKFCKIKQIMNKFYNKVLYKKEMK